MSTELRGQHLQQTQLTSKEFIHTLSQFGQWLAEAQFQVPAPSKSEKVKTCNDPGLRKASESLLIELGVYTSVLPLIDLRSVCWRISGSFIASDVHCHTHPSIMYC